MAVACLLCRTPAGVHRLAKNGTLDGSKFCY
jgi:hypothetical protein